MADYPLRPATPQAMLHRMPDKEQLKETEKPSRYIILLLASTLVAGKVQIAKSVAAALSCPLFQGDSLHETCAKAASVGFSKPKASEQVGSEEEEKVNKERYERMWLSKLTRTGLLFPEESKAAMSGFDGFAGKRGGSVSSSSSRRGSTSSAEMDIASGSDAEGSLAGSFKSTFSNFGPVPKVGYVNKFVQLSTSRQGKGNEEGNKALMVLTHPEIEKWCRESIRKVIGEYGIGVVFVPLYEEELPVLDPRAMSSFGSFGSGLGGFGDEVKKVGEKEIVLRIDFEADIKGIIEEIVEGARDIMNQ